MSTIQKNISLTEEQVEYLDKEMISLSKLVQRAIDELMNKKGMGS